MGRVWDRSLYAAAGGGGCDGLWLQRACDGLGCGEGRRRRTYYSQSPQLRGQCRAQLRCPVLRARVEQTPAAALEGAHAWHHRVDLVASRLRGWIGPCGKESRERLRKILDNNVVQWCVTQSVSLVRRGWIGVERRLEGILVVREYRLDQRAILARETHRSPFLRGSTTKSVQTAAPGWRFESESPASNDAFTARRRSNRSVEFTRPFSQANFDGGFCANLCEIAQIPHAAEM